MTSRDAEIDSKLEALLRRIEPDPDLFQMKHFILGVVVSAIPISPRYLLSDIYDSSFEANTRNREEFIFLGEELWTDLQRKLAQGIAPLLRPQLQSFVDSSNQTGELSRLLEETIDDLDQFFSGMAIRPDLEDIESEKLHKILYELSGARDLLGSLSSQNGGLSGNGGEFESQAKAALSSHAAYWMAWVPELYSILRTKKFSGKQKSRG